MTRSNFKHLCAPTVHRHVVKTCSQPHARTRHWQTRCGAAGLRRGKHKHESGPACVDAVCHHLRRSERQRLGQCPGMSARLHAALAALAALCATAAARSYRACDVGVSQGKGGLSSAQQAEDEAAHRHHVSGKPQHERGPLATQVLDAAADGCAPHGGRLQPAPGRPAGHRHAVLRGAPPAKRHRVPPMPCPSSSALEAWRTAQSAAACAPARRREPRGVYGDRARGPLPALPLAASMLWEHDRRQACLPEATGSTARPLAPP